MITVNGDKRPWTKGLTVRELLERENYTFRLISVWVNDNVVENTQYDDCKIPDGADVQVIHNICGG